jgi:hypothetical protein
MNKPQEYGFCKKCSMKWVSLLKKLKSKMYGFYGYIYRVCKLSCDIYDDNWWLLNINWKG